MKRKLLYTAGTVLVLVAVLVILPLKSGEPPIERDVLEDVTYGDLSKMKADDDGQIGMSWSITYEGAEGPETIEMGTKRVGLGIDLNNADDDQKKAIIDATLERMRQEHNVRISQGDYVSLEQVACGEGESLDIGLVTAAYALPPPTCPRD